MTFAIALGRAAVAAAMLAALSLTGYALLPRPFRPPKARLLIPLSLSAGTLAVGWLMWVVGTLIGTTAALLVAALLAAVSLRALPAWWRDARRVLCELGARALSTPFAAALVALPLLLALPQLALPLIDSDGLRYHAAFAKLFLLEGRVSYYPWDVTGAFPQTAEMLYMAALRLAGGETIKFLHFFFFVAALATLALVARTLLAPFLLAAAPVVLAPAAAAFIDHVALFHVAVAIHLLLGAPASRRRVAAALPLAAAFATKYTAAPAVALLFLLTRRRLLALAMIAAAFAPFAIRNALQTGDPFYPIGRALLHRSLDGVPAGSLAYATQFHSRVKGVVGIPWIPGDAQPDEVAGLQHLLGLFALLVVLRHRRLRPIAALVFVYLAVAALYRVPARYLFPMFLALALLEATALAYVPRKLAAPIALLVCAPALLCSAQLLLTLGAPFAYLRGPVDRARYLGAVVPGYRAAEVVNALPRGGRVMALDFPAPYYFDRPWIVEGILHDPPLKRWLASARTADDLLARLRALDVRVLVVTPGYGGGTSQTLIALASDAREAGMLDALRQRLRFRARIDRVDVFEMP